MPVYKNISNSKKTFYGVEIGPGEVKEVPGVVNAPEMLRCTKPVVKKVEPKAEKVVEKKTTSRPRTTSSSSRSRSRSRKTTKSSK